MELPSIITWDLSEQLADPDIIVRERAQASLSRLCKSGEVDILVVASRLRHGDADVRMRCLQILGAVGCERARGFVEAVGARLGDGDIRVRRAAATALSQLQADGAAELVRGIGAGKPSALRLHALQGLAQQGAAAGEYADAVAACLGDADEAVAATAGEVLELFGARGALALADLVRDTHDYRARARAAECLEHLGADGAATISKSARHADAAVRVRAMHVLGRMGDVGAATLAKLLQDTDSHVRWLAAETLGEMGSSAHPHVTGKVERLNDADGNVQIAAASALGSLGAEGATAVAIYGLEHHDPKLRAKAAALLGTLEAQPVTLSSLTVKLQDEHPEVRARAASSLRSLGQNGANVLAASFEGGDGAWARMCAESVLRGMGAQGAAAIAARLADPQPAARIHAARALGRLPAHALGGHLEALERAMSDSHSQVRRAAAEALGRLGAAGADILEQHKWHRHPHVRSLAMEVNASCQAAQGLFAAEEVSSKLPRRLRHYIDFDVTSPLTPIQHNFRKSPRPIVNFGISD